VQKGWKRGEGSGIAASNKECFYLSVVCGGGAPSRERNDLSVGERIRGGGGNHIFRGLLFVRLGTVPWRRKKRGKRRI